jgi:TolB-like protein
VRVIARASSHQFRATTKSPKQIGAELGVQYLLYATVRWQKSGAGGVSRVQVRPELITVRDAASKWQEPFDAALTDVFQVQADIASRVAGGLDVALGDSTKRVLAATPTVSLCSVRRLPQG